VVVAIVAVCRLSFACCAHPPRRHPFPTRRSSDLASHDHDGVYAPLTHSHPEYAPADHGHSEYAAVSHTHGIADVTGLRTELDDRSEEHTSELQSRENLVCRLLLEKKQETENPTKQ